MTIFKPPQQIRYDKFYKKIFLAGTIDMGDSEDWQSDLYPILDKKFQLLHIYNPRRDDWNSSCKQTPEDPQFYQQVN